MINVVLQFFFRKKNSRKSESERFVLLVGFFLIAGAIVTIRIFTLAVIQHGDYLEVADRQYSINRTLPSTRGTIYFQDKFNARIVAATDMEVRTLVASPKTIKDANTTALALAPLIGKDAASLKEQLAKKDDSYELLAKDIPDEASKKIANLHLPGLSLLPDIKRYYPHNELAANVLGFRGYDDSTKAWKGVYGVEKEYNDELSSGSSIGSTDQGSAAYWLSVGKRIIANPSAGSDVVLTIDYNIQERAEEELAFLVKKWDAESGSVLILEPSTGRILALGSSQKYDPNEYSKVTDYSVFKDPIAESMYELGSVFKPITMAAAVNENTVTPDTTYYDPGVLKYGSYSIYNFDLKSYGMQTMTQVLEKSLNTGAVFAQKKIGKETFKKYVDAFGFGQSTGSDLPNEALGNTINLNSNRDLEYATASFGQGIAVTPLQMATAIGALANGGVLMQPHVVDAIVDSSGVAHPVAPKPRGNPVTKDTAETLTKMLVSVVRIGYENRAGVKGYFVAGKTGTAQIPNPDKRGYSDDVIHTFVGYAPAFNPKFLVYMQLNRPRGNRFASNTLTASFHNLAEFILNYYEIPPDEK